MCNTINELLSIQMPLASQKSPVFKKRALYRRRSEPGYIVEEEASPIDCPCKYEGFVLYLYKCWSLLTFYQPMTANAVMTCLNSP